VDELSAQFDGNGQPEVVPRPDASPNPVTRFEYLYVQATRDQSLRGGQTGYAGSDDDNVDAVQASPPEKERNNQAASNSSTMSLEERTRDSGNPSVRHPGGPTVTPARRLSRMTTRLGLLASGPVGCRRPASGRSAKPCLS
jgi:hypothetical protein